MLRPVVRRDAAAPDFGADYRLLYVKYVPRIDAAAPDLGADTGGNPQMTFEQLMTAAGLTPRRYQLELAERVTDHLAPRTPIAIAVQATTGVGKTWAMAFAVLQAAREDRRVIWSTHTIFLRGQVLATLDAALRAAWKSGDGRPVLAERRGRADYPSKSRTMRMRHALADRRAPRENIAMLDDLAAWPGLIADFVAAYGEPPVPQSLVCLTAACPAAEQAAYLAARDSAADARIVVQTHALTLIEARFGRLSADLVIFDEADTLASVAAGAVETRLPLDDLAALAAEAQADIGQALDTLRSAAAAGPIRWRDAAMAETARAIAARLGGAARPAEPELAQLLRDTAEDLVHFAGVDQPRTGAALIQDTAGPTLAVAAVDAAGWLGGAMRERQTVLMSATLGRYEDDDLAAACRRMGFWQVEQVSVSPAVFGSAAFRLADRSAPPPFAAEGAPEPGFFDYAARMVRQAARGGRTLVLCASYGDAEELGGRLGDAVIAQRRGQSLAPLVERFRAEPGAVLVTPSAWAGLDLPHVVDNVVIVRLPIPRPDELREAVLAMVLERRGMSTKDARGILASEARAEAMRRLTQGMGRGIRSADDRCTIWIADPRFPLPGNLVADLRNRLMQGPAEAWKDMAKAIPLRFRKDGARSAYGHARVVPLAAVADVAA
jgi:Rad3-related DNA helicase